MYIITQSKWRAISEDLDRPSITPDNMTSYSRGLDSRGERFILTFRETGAGFGCGRNLKEFRDFVIVPDDWETEAGQERGLS